MMWGGLFTGIFARSWARSVAGIALVTLTIILFLFNLRRQGERAGRAAARLDQMERTNAIQQKMLDAASRRPRDRDDLVERLRDGQF
jgi:type II secretory pathway component PulJ